MTVQLTCHYLCSIKTIIGPMQAELIGFNSIKDHEFSCQLCHPDRAERRGN
jgi:hypothetical protein